MGLKQWITIICFLAGLAVISACSPETPAPASTPEPSVSTQQAHESIRRGYATALINQSAAMMTRSAAESIILVQATLRNEMIKTLAAVGILEQTYEAIETAQPSTLVNLAIQDAAKNNSPAPTAVPPTPTAVPPTPTAVPATPTAPPPTAPATQAATSDQSTPRPTEAQGTPSPTTATPASSPLPTALAMGQGGLPPFPLLLALVVCQS